MLESCLQLWCRGKGRSRCCFCQLLWKPTQPICWIPQQERTTSWNWNWKIRTHLQSKFNHFIHEIRKVFSPRLLEEEEHDALCHTYVNSYGATKMRLIRNFFYKCKKWVSMINSAATLTTVFLLVFIINIVNFIF